MKDYFDMTGNTRALVKFHLLPKTSDKFIVVIGDLRNVIAVVNKMEWNILYAEVLEEKE